MNKRFSMMFTFIGNIFIMKINKYKKKILTIIFDYLDKDNCMVFLFGSYCYGNYNKSSDIDIGIICNYKIKDIDFLEMSEKINDEFLIDVDLVDFNLISKNIKDKILNKGIKIWHTGKRCKGILKNLKSHIKN